MDLACDNVLVNVADGTDGRYERNSWTLDTALRGLPLVCKVGLSLTVDKALEFGKYFRFILQGGGEGSGVVQSCTRTEMLWPCTQALCGPGDEANYACTAHFFYYGN